MTDLETEFAPTVDCRSRRGRGVPLQACRPRGDRDQAASSFKTAIFWDNKLTDAYINLAKIHIERGECLQVKTYVAQALEVDPDNPEVTALQRQADRCSK